MSNLIKKELTLDSREVAEMVEKNHKELLRDIRTYEGYLGESNFALTDFFIPSTYVSIQNKELPNYQITKKGCEFIAHKLTGRKGALFTAAYINRFHELEGQAQQQILPTDLSPELQVLINMELKQKQLEDSIAETKEEITGIKENILADVEEWRDWANSQLRKMGANLGDYRRPYNESYEELEKRAGCNLERRLKKRIDRMEKAGATKTAIKNTNNLDIINEDKKLKEIYTNIVKAMSIKYL